MLAICKVVHYTATCFDEDRIGVQITELPAIKQTFSPGIMLARKTWGMRIYVKEHRMQIIGGRHGAES